MLNVQCLDTHILYVSDFNYPNKIIFVKGNMTIKNYLQKWSIKIVTVFYNDHYITKQTNWYQTFSL